VAAKAFLGSQAPAPPLRRIAVSGGRKYFLTTISILVMMSHKGAVNEQNIPRSSTIWRFLRYFGLLGGKSSYNKMIGLSLTCLIDLPAAPGWTAGGGGKILD
jgi:hypothetical protein